MKVFSINDLRYLLCGPIDLEIKATRCIGLSGASGSGKSLLLRALADLDDHQGEITLDDIAQRDISAHEWRKKVALLSAETHWWFDTVGEHFTDLPVQQLQALGFERDVSSWSIARLSTGEKQRLGLLRLLENKPEVLLLDEPTANLDKHNTVLFEQFVLDYLNSHSACALWVGHDTEQLEKVCHQRYEINKGVLISLDTEEVMAACN